MTLPEQRPDIELPGLDLSISLLAANVYGAAVAIILTPLLFGIYYLVNPSFDLLLLSKPIVLIVSIVLGVFVHELLHGLTWQIASKQPSSVIRYGINWKLLTPYAHCSEPINVQYYRIGILMPTIILGLIPYIVVLFVQEPNLLLFSIIFTIAGSGDLVVFWIIRNLHSDTVVMDHPSRAGCYVFLIKKIGK